MDSLILSLGYVETDVDRAQTLVQISGLYRDIHTDSALIYASEGYKLALNIENDSLIADALNSVGNIYVLQTKYGAGLKALMGAVQYTEKLKNPGMRMAKLFNNIGMVYYYQHNHPKTLEYFNAAAERLIESGDSSNTALVLNNIAGVYMEDSLFDKAEIYFQRGLDLSVQMENHYLEGVLLNGLGSVCIETGRQEEAEEYLNQSLELKRVYSTELSVVNVLEALGSNDVKMEKWSAAKQHYLEAEELCLGKGFIRIETRLYKGLAEIYENLGDHKNGLMYTKKYIAIDDSLEAIEASEALTELQTKYDNVRHERTIEVFQKNEVIRKKELDQHQTFNWALGIGGVFILALAALIYFRLRDSRRTNIIVTEQKKIVEYKNNEIVSSINYAKRIQEAMLSSEDKDLEGLPDHFIFFKPKDIVSGDFYWIANRKDSFYIAAVDCTGHGVPGGFLTMLGTAFLNEIVSDGALISPAQILDLLRNRIIKELRQSMEDRKTGATTDGMDISLIRIDKGSLSAEWAGANNPLWILRSDGTEIEELKGDKQPIGIYYEMNPFTNHKLQFSKGDRFYLFSDGYVDQFGLPDEASKPKKFRAKKLKQILQDNKGTTLAKQQVVLDTELTKWKGQLEQVDDICVIGMEL